MTWKMMGMEQANKCLSADGAKVGKAAEKVWELLNDANLTMMEMRVALMVVNDFLFTVGTANVLEDNLPGGKHYAHGQRPK